MDLAYLKAFTETPTYKELKKKILEAQDLRVYSVISRLNPLNVDEQATLLRTQGELMGIRVAFAMIETAGKGSEDGSGNDRESE